MAQSYRGILIHFIAIYLSAQFFFAKNGQTTGFETDRYVSVPLQ